MGQRCSLKNLFCLCIMLLAMFVFSGCAPKVRSDNPATVTFQFENEGNNVLTFWRKMENGQKSSAFPVGVSGMALAFNSSSFSTFEPYTMQLDPGIYYLDSFQVNLGKIYVSQAGHFSTRNGWDDTANSPKYLAIKVSQGQVLTLPRVRIVIDSKDKKAAIGYFVFDDPSEIFIVGAKAQKDGVTEFFDNQ